MYQTKFIKADQLDILEELVNMWLKEQVNVNVVDMKFEILPNENGNEYIAIMIYEQSI